MDWLPPDRLPARIDEEIDINEDGQAEFHIRLETGTLQAELIPYSAEVLALEGVYRLEESLAIRVELKNPGKPGAR